MGTLGLRLAGLFSLLLPVLLILTSTSFSKGKKSWPTSGGKSNVALTAASVEPNTGLTAGGKPVTITGTGSQQLALMAFGSVLLTAVTATSLRQFSATSSFENTGTVAVEVTDPNGQFALLPSAFTYTSASSVSSVSPDSGPGTARTAVTIMAGGFQSGAIAVFGSPAVLLVTLVCFTEIQACAPSWSAGAISIAVTNPNTQTGTLSAEFTFFDTVSPVWTASSASVPGHNISRSSTSGVPYAKLNSNLIPSTTCTDDNVQAGQTCRYVTTAVNGCNLESGYSEQA